MAKSTSRIVTIHDSNSAFNSCYFVNNLSTENGPVASVGGSSFFRDSIFKNDTAKSELTNNTMSPTICTINCSFLDILNCSFVTNSALSSGGAIFHSQEQKLIIKLSLFEYNIVSSVSQDGGTVCVYKSSTSKISDSKFNENVAGRSDRNHACGSYRNRAGNRGGAIFRAQGK